MKVKVKVEVKVKKGKWGRPDLSRIVLEVGGIVVVSYRSNQFRSEKSFFSEGGK